MKNARFALCCAVASMALSLHAADPETLHGPWKHQDVGAVTIPGTASWNANVFTVNGTLDTWGTNDGFHFVWQKMRGDGEIVARVLSVENTLNHAKGGVMFRESLDAASKHAQACVTAEEGPAFLVRADTGGKTVSSRTTAEKKKFPYWVKLVRTGNRFIGYESPDGSEWTVIGTTNILMGPEIFAGLTGSSHKKDQRGSTTMDNVALTPVKGKK